MSRSRFIRTVLTVAAAASVFSMVGCTGSNSILAGRPQPPSQIRQRVLVAIQNPSPIATGALQIVDARYDIRNSENGTVPTFFISGYKGSLPSLILNYPEESAGYVYGSGDGSLIPVNYGTEQISGSISGLAGTSSSVFVTQDGRYAFAANQSSQYLTVIDNVTPAVVQLNLPNVYKIAVNPSGTVALAFVQNSNYAYRVIHLQQPNGTVAPVPTFPNEANWPAAVSPVDCQPVNLPIYCVVPVLDQNGNPIAFNRPYNTIFSSDGTTAWLMNCGVECGNSAVDPVTGLAGASVSFLNPGPLNIYNFPGSTYPSPPPATPQPTETRRVSVPGGATMAVYGNGILYVSGQQLQKDGLLEGFLSLINLTSSTVTASYPISDGTHTKMLLGDDNTLWIGSQLCQTGERTAMNLVNGCLTFFNISTNSVLVEPWYGDLTGLCAIIDWHKMYTAYGGQIHIYATTNTGITSTGGPLAPGYSAGSEINNANVTVQGTAFDVAYMDAPSNAAD
jgi:hypothetical protein